LYRSAVAGKIRFSSKSGKIFSNELSKVFGNKINYTRKTIKGLRFISHLEWSEGGPDSRCFKWMQIHQSLEAQVSTLPQKLDHYMYPDNPLDLPMAQSNTASGTDKLEGLPAFPDCVGSASASGLGHSGLALGGAAEDGNLPSALSIGAVVCFLDSILAGGCSVRHVSDSYAHLSLIHPQPCYRFARDQTQGNPIRYNHHWTPPEPRKAEQEAARSRPVLLWFHFQIL
jgi:hypothetical protein